MLSLPEQLGEVDELHLRMARGERLVDFRTQRQRKDGTIVDVSLTVSPVRDGQGTIVGAATTTRDISADEEREAARREQQKLEALGRLAGGVAHDFNNLLTAILGYGTIALESAEPGAAQEALEEILLAANRAADLTHQLLAFSRRSPRVTATLNLNNVVNGLLPLLRRVLDEDLELAVDLADDVPPVEADRTQLEQVVVNLVANARDALAWGGRVAIETRAVEHGEHRRPYARLTVTDDGIGMDAATQAHAFEPFFTTKESGCGTGLGLSTVYGIVEQSGGHVSVSSAPGRGTDVRICLPAVANAATAAPTRLALRETSPGGTETILVVEDDEGLLEMAATVLERAGYSVLRVSDPRKAKQLVLGGNRRVDLLVTDVVMPGISGPELARQLAEEGMPVPTIFMSGYTGGAVERQGLLGLIDEILDKPFAPQLLLERVRAALDLSARLT